MPSVDVRDSDGGVVGTVELDGGLFGIQPNVPVLHQVVTAQLAAARRGTQSTKTRAEVSGGGAKPFRQKGTGRARQGSTRAPHWSGGGIALGPKPRSYRQRTPKKMIRLALASALSDRASEGRVAVLDGWGFSEPRTSAAKALIDAVGLAGKVMVVVHPDDEVAMKSFRNLPQVQLVTTRELNAYDILCSDWVVFTRDVLPGTTGDLLEKPAARSGAATEDEPAEPADEPIEAVDELIEATTDEPVDEVDAGDADAEEDA
jgi:large subunit ribosomal protein L4